MTASAYSDLTPAGADGAAAAIVEAPHETNAVLSRIDFANVVGKHFLVYGWVLGFTKSVQSATVDIGGVVIDIVKHATPVRRPDVAQHFSMAPGNDEHGFYALVDLPGELSSADELRLLVTLYSGETAESRWPVSFHNEDAATAVEPHVATLNRLLPRLSRQEAKRLIDFARPALGLQTAKEAPPSLPASIRFGIDLCCVLENRILVVSGWRLDPVEELTLAELRVGDSYFRFLENSISFDRPDVNPEPHLHRKRNAAQLPGFIFVSVISPRDAEMDEALFAFSAGAATEQLTHPLNHNPNGAQRDLLSLIGKMEGDSALLLIEHVASVLQPSPGQPSLDRWLELVRYNTIERLPLSIQKANPRYSLHIDLAVPVAGKGIYVIGWFNAGPKASPKIVCHCGCSTFAVSDNWSRHIRADVTSHLAGAGIQAPDDEHGFSCYVPLSSGDAPYYLSVESEPGEVRRMRITVPEKPEAALQTVRTLLTSFDSGHPGLRFLMDRHIGPAVTAAWAARHKPLRRPEVRSYGAMPTDPSASIIVPLYGRHDLVEYQMALFANDPEFHGVELIYVVDDPAMVAEFTRACADLYGVYQIPFVVVSPGSNLGFAGANNLGAEVARGDHLLFLNSDVMPKYPKWVGDLLRIYKSLPTPGALGAKLLYEDGSIQHAGMAFRRYPGWGNLWINDHPFKGQSPVGLSGVREAGAVTAACALIEASLFRDAGGFSEDYIIGDFEDSDLCLRLLSAGRRNYVALDVELYHLERQSQSRVGDVSWRTNLTLYNCWLHNSRWGDLIGGRADAFTQCA